MRQRPDALILIAVYEFVMAAMLLIAACVVLPIALLITPFASDGFNEFITRFAVVGVALTIVFGFGVASGIVGFGLLMLKEWARIGAILLAIPTLIVFPIWTVLSILIIAYLAGEEGRALFRRSRRAGMVSARSYRQEARDDVSESSFDDPTVPPPTWGEASDPADYDQPNNEGKRNAPESPGATMTWQEPSNEVDDQGATGDGLSKPPVI
jgi:hypothetical protein